MICSQCNKEFTKSHGSQKYCSPECKKLSIKIYMKEYRQTDKYKKIQKEHNLLEKRREYLKDYLYHQKS